VERFTRQPAPDAGAQNAQTSSTQAPRSAHSAGKFTLDNPTAASKLLVVSLIVAALAVTTVLAINVFRTFSTSSLVKDDRFQAVFLDNGQVYFGHLSNVNRDYVRLTDIYYLQVDQQIQPDQQQAGETSQDQQTRISLAKLGNELHGPEDEMFILKSKVVFWENLKTDGQVTQAIDDFVNGETNEPGDANQGG